MMDASSESHAVETLDFLKDPLWYKDAVIYQVHVKSFFDANDDGIGDFRGLIDKLDYIVSLGVNTLWILPFYPWPPSTPVSAPITAPSRTPSASLARRTSVVCE